MNPDHSKYISFIISIIQKLAAFSLLFILIISMVACSGDGEKFPSEQLNPDETIEEINNDETSDNGQNGPTTDAGEPIDCLLYTSDAADES